MRTPLLRLFSAIFLVSGMLAASGCSPEDTVSFRLSDLEQASRTPGFHREAFTLSSGRTVAVFTSMPAVGETSIRPLVVALHGGGPATPYRGEALVRALVSPGLESLAPIIVAPDLPFQAWAHPDAADLVASLIDAALEAWPVDPSRIVLTGYSAGGIGTWYMAAEKLNHVAAGIPVAADPVGGEAAAAIRIPMFHIHGTNDAQFPIEDVRSDVGALIRAGVPVELHETTGAGHADVAAYLDDMKTAASWLLACSDCS